MLCADVEIDDAGPRGSLLRQLLVSACLGAMLIFICHIADLGIVPPLGAAVERPRRSLVAPRSGSRSPRCSAPLLNSVLPCISVISALALALRAGHVANIKSLVFRRDLDGSLVMLSEYASMAGRWACQSEGDEQLRVFPGNLVPIDAGGQAFAMLRFRASFGSPAEYFEPRV